MSLIVMKTTYPFNHKDVQGKYLRYYARNITSMSSFSYELEAILFINRCYNALVDQVPVAILKKANGEKIPQGYLPYDLISDAEIRIFEDSSRTVNAVLYFDPKCLLEGITSLALDNSGQ